MPSSIFNPIPLLHTLGVLRECAAPDKYLHLDGPVLNLPFGFVPDFDSLEWTSQCTPPYAPSRGLYPMVGGCFAKHPGDVPPKEPSDLSKLVQCIIAKESKDGVSTSDEQKHAYFDRGDFKGIPVEISPMRSVFWHLRHGVQDKTSLRYLAAHPSESHMLFFKVLLKDGTNISLSLEHSKSTIFSVLLSDRNISMPIHISIVEVEDSQLGDRDLLTDDESGDHDV